MKLIIKKRSLLTFFITLVTVLGLSFSATAQVPDGWNLGPHTLLIEESSGPLEQAMNGEAGLESAEFVGQVGGVAFDEIATATAFTSQAPIYLSYDEAKPDGERLRVSINDEVFYPLLPDWELVPLAQYADSDYTACVSLFGENANEDVYDIVYHPAFQNTLLGMRLLQADILLIDLGEF